MTGTYSPELSHRQGAISIDTNKIALTRDIESIKPLFERYMWHMKQYVVVDDGPVWIARANDYLALYRTEPQKNVYVVSTDDEVFGFALVDKSFRFNREGNAIAEFYVAPEKQRHGYGHRLATHAFSQHTGQWEVSVYSGNTAGCLFWEKVVSDYTSGSYEIKTRKGYDGKGFTFTNAGPVLEV